jgi:hypothetical protein
VMYLYAAQWLIQCGLSLLAVGLLVAKPFTSYRPLPRMTPPHAKLAGHWFCAETGPFIWCQFIVGLCQIYNARDGK